MLEAAAARPAPEAAEMVASVAYGRVDEQPRRNESAAAAPEAATSSIDSARVEEAPVAANGLTQQKADAAKAAASPVAELTSPEVAALSEEMPVEAAEQRKPAWSQPAPAAKDQAQRDKCASDDRILAPPDLLHQATA